MKLGIFKKIIPLVFFLFVYLLAVLHNLQDLSSMTKDWICILSNESAESQPLDHQGIPTRDFFLIAFLKTGFGGFVGQAGQHVGC